MRRPGSRGGELLLSICVAYVATQRLIGRLVPTADGGDDSATRSVHERAIRLEDELEGRPTICLRRLMASTEFDATCEPLRDCDDLFLSRRCQAFDPGTEVTLSFRLMGMRHVPPPFEIAQRANSTITLSLVLQDEKINSKKLIDVFTRS